MRKPLAALIGAVEPLSRRTRIVAIDGFGGSGKTELAKQLCHALGRSVVVHTDDFARPNVRGWEWERLRAQVLEPISNDAPGRYQRYDWDADRLAEWRDVPVGDTVIVEGVSSMRAELGTYWDFAVWVSAPYDLRLERGVQRDGEAMRSHWTDVWMPEEQKYFDAQRPDKKAEIVVDGTRPYAL